MQGVRGRCDPHPPEFSSKAARAKRGGGVWRRAWEGVPMTPQWVCSHFDELRSAPPPPREGLATPNTLLMPCCVQATPRKAEMGWALALTVRLHFLVPVCIIFHLRFFVKCCAVEWVQ